jgi:endonuclease/exonuclease/phosphatase family metal-dependent hydrolase
VRRVRVATFNIRRGLGIDGVIDLDRTAEAIRATGAEVVALQEVDRNLPRSGRVDQPSELGYLAELPVEFRATLRRARGEYGIALLGARLEAIEWVRLPRLGREEPRGLLVALREGLWICSTHLSTSPEARALQLRTIAEVVSGLEGPAVLTGDLNAGGRELGSLGRAGLVPGPPLRTFRGLAARQIDHILTAPAVTLERAWTVPTNASDHLPLVADLRY